MYLQPVPSSLGRVFDVYAEDGRKLCRISAFQQSWVRNGRRRTFWSTGGGDYWRKSQSDAIRELLRRA